VRRRTLSQVAQASVRLPPAVRLPSLRDSVPFFELTPDLPFGFAQDRLGLLYAVPFGTGVGWGGGRLSLGERRPRTLFWRGMHSGREVKIPRVSGRNSFRCLWWCRIARGPSSGKERPPLDDSGSGSSGGHKVKILTVRWWKFLSVPVVVQDCPGSLRQAQGRLFVGRRAPSSG
jgi:hypothetical protein